MEIKPLETATLSAQMEMEAIKQEINNVNTNDSTQKDKVHNISIDSKDDESALEESAVMVEKAGISKEKAQKKLEKLEKRLEKLEEKLDNTESEKKAESLEKKIEKAEEKIEYYEGLVDAMSSNDKSINNLLAKKYIAELRLDDTDSEKKESKLEKVIENIDAQLEAKGFDDTENDDIEPDETDNETETDNTKKAGAAKSKTISKSLSISTDAKLQSLYNELYNLEKEYDKTTSESKILELEEAIDELEDNIAAREEELENASDIDDDEE